MSPLSASAIDFETTGSLPGYRSAPWQVGVVPIEGGRIDGNFFESLLDVGNRPFNPHAPGRHAQLREAIAAAPTLGQLWPALSRRLAGRVLVAHNVGTERTVLAAAAPLHVLGPWIDTLVLARLAWPNLPSHALEDLIPILGLSSTVSTWCPDRLPHDACYDAAACAVLLLHVLEQPGWQTLTTADLISLCAG